MSRLGLEAIAVAVLALLGWIWLGSHDAKERQIGRDEIIKLDAEAVEKQKQKDAADLARARKDHEAEMANAGLGYAAALRDLQSRIVQPRPITPGTCAAESHPADQGGSAGSGPEVVRVPDYPDLRYPYLVLAHRLDELNAAAREVNEVSQ